jgi:hypothetical protein
MSLDDEYDQACWDACTEAERRGGYDARWWKTMLRTYKGVEASIRLIRKSGGVPQSGFTRLLRMDMPHLTVEYMVLEPKWRPLFATHPEVLETAHFILQQAGMRPPDDGLTP